jgi:maltose O-acetyltransferase
MHAAYDHLVAVLLRLRVRRLVFALRWRSRWHRAELVCDIEPSVRIGRHLRVDVQPGTRNVLRIGSGSRLGDDVRIELRGGSLVIGPGAEVKTRCVLGVGGVLEMGGTNIVQYGCIISCDEAVTLEQFAGLGEYATVIDSSHVLGGIEGDWHHQLRTAPVVIGRNAWICAKATIARGVHVGDDAVVGANSLVVKDVPPAHLASGVPAQVLRPFATDPAPPPPFASPPVFVSPS